VDERLKVTLKDQTLMDIPMIKVSQVVLFGRVTVTPFTVEALLGRDIELCYLTEYGRFVGRLHSSFSKNSLLRREQYRASFEESRTLSLAKRFVAGKLANMRTYMVRVQRNDPSPSLETAIDRIKAAEGAVENSPSLDVVRGHEGEGSAAYFSVFQGFIRAEGFTFERRVKRPPKDPVNSLLSFGYVLLANDLNSAVNTVGFDPYIGFLHADKYGKPSLPLDLMEEFRPVIVDSAVLTCINKRIIAPDDFEVAMGDVYKLKDDARKKFLVQYEERKNTEIKHPVTGDTVSYLRCFELQARFLAKFLMGEIGGYPPFLVK
jgi:CRISPR-associated protein Cas1